MKINILFDYFKLIHKTLLFLSFPIKIELLIGQCSTWKKSLSVVLNSAGLGS